MSKRRTWKRFHSCPNIIHKKHNSQGRHLLFADVILSRIVFLIYDEVR